jgi:hypothetical protein
MRNHGVVDRYAGRSSLLRLQRDPGGHDLSPANKNAGPTPVDVRAIDQAYNQQVRRLTLRLLRETGWQTDEVTSAPVGKGSRIPIKATLRRADWNKNAYVRYGGRKQQATVQFKAAGSDTWVPVKP